MKNERVSFRLIKEKIVNNDYEGMLFHDEIFENIYSGVKTQAFIKNIREDGKFDIILQKVGSKSDDSVQEKILNS